jgi:hypothetical protein
MVIFLVLCLVVAEPEPVQVAIDSQRPVGTQINLVLRCDWNSHGQTIYSKKHLSNV